MIGDERCEECEDKSRYPRSGRSTSPTNLFTREGGSDLTTLSASTVFSACLSRAPRFWRHVKEDVDAPPQFAPPHEGQNSLEEAMMVKLSSEDMAVRV